MQSSFEERVRKAKADFPQLTVYYGTGYPIDRPHILAIDRGNWNQVTVYPDGDNGLSGMGLGKKEINY